ncbi:hypothetical protein E4P41_19520, partial [Geodermatophilus sp. DF01-2]
MRSRPSRPPARSRTPSAPPARSRTPSRPPARSRTPRLGERGLRRAGPLRRAQGRPDPVAGGGLGAPRRQRALRA